ncbi:MAG: hypothetical protein KF894_03735 [Labilithrix sp.]|nr:hypothetical protein [Labilithrix sp.]
MRLVFPAAALVMVVAACASDPAEGSDAGDGGADADVTKPDASADAGGRLDAGGDADGGSPDAACGRLTTPCAVGAPCEGAPDCETGLCREGTCRAVAPDDGIKNGDETDVDCGGTNAPACADGKGCAAGADCTSLVCTAGVCQAPSPTDEVKNGDETDVDCGGTNAPACADGKSCAAGADCTSLVCHDGSKKCLAPTDSDGVKNGDETGTDCGGPTTAKKCPPGQGCSQDSDCNNVRCSAAAPKTCDPPSSSDGLRNGTETDIDCGGGAPTNAPRCAPGRLCGLDGDCAAPGTTCGYANRCVPARSCRVHEGGDTCGAREVGQAAASHESCCASVELPGSAIKVDKYEITAGRMREFIRAVGNDVAGWVSANRGITQQIPDSMVQYLPSGLSTPQRTITRCDADGSGCSSRTQRFGVYEHLGNTVFMPDRPCVNCGQGCWLNSGNGQNGHPTYWWPSATQSSQFGAMARAFTQEELDVKSLNCVTQPLLAAFCAWDGGRLPTQAELGGGSGAWGPASHPWGGSPSYLDTVAGAANRQAYSFQTNEFLVPMRTAAGGYNLSAYDQNTTNYNPFPSSPSIFQARYVFPMPGNPNTNDQAYAVAAPGRMRNDFRAIGPGANDGYFDVLGNVMEVVGDGWPCTALNQTTSQCASSSGGTGFCGADGRCYDDDNHNGWARVAWVGASFEGHGASRQGHNLSVMTKYGKQGGRCVRP